MAEVLRKFCTDVYSVSKQILHAVVFLCRMLATCFSYDMELGRCLEIFVSIFVIDNLLLQYVICIQTGLGVLPDERNISVPVMVWRSCAYTIMTVGL